MTEEPDAYTRLITLLNAHGARYRVIDHEPEGRTDIVSAMRGNDLADAAKCIILMIKLGKKVTRYVLAVVPGDARVDFGRIRELFGATYVSFAASDTAERLAGSVAGTILPLAFDSALELIVDPAVIERREIYFNAGRLDRSIALNTSDYIAVAHPRLARLAAEAASEPSD
jgi:Ala-tRNA(Pro) deacylase